MLYVVWAIQAYILFNAYLLETRVLALEEAKEDKMGVSADGLALTFKAKERLEQEVPELMEECERFELYKFEGGVLRAKILYVHRTYEQWVEIQDEAIIIGKKVYNPALMQAMSPKGVEA